MSDDETIALRATVIAGMRYADDYRVIWRGLPVGRIMRASGAVQTRSLWTLLAYLDDTAGQLLLGTPNIGPPLAKGYSQAL